MLSKKEISSIFENRNDHDQLYISVKVVKISNTLSTKDTCKQKQTRKNKNKQNTSNLTIVFQLRNDLDRYCTDVAV